MLSMEHIARFLAIVCILKGFLGLKGGYNLRIRSFHQKMLILAEGSLKKACICHQQNKERKRRATA